MGWLFYLPADELFFSVLLNFCSVNLHNKLYVLGYVIMAGLHTKRSQRGEGGGIPNNALTNHSQAHPRYQQPIKCPKAGRNPN